MVREHHACISIGSNLGDRQQNCLKALQMVEKAGVGSVIASSGMYETDPVGYTDQPAFINMAAVISTSFGPKELLTALKDLEKRLGREKGMRWGPRVIDMDIVLYDELVLDEPDLRIPHERMHERAFVLIPLCEIAPNSLHPRLGKTVAGLLSDLGRDTGGVRRLDDPP